jgi:hypothetical protein
LLVLLVVLVAGLLRSHAEILRRLGPVDDEPGTTGRVAAAARVAAVSQRDRGLVSAPELAGVTPAGDAVKLAFDGAGTAPTLLAFLTSGCGTCAAFWETLGEGRLPDGARTVIVTHGADRERPAKLRTLAPAGVPVVMSSQAWADYEIPGAPYFVLVDQMIRGEGVATTWHALASLVSDAIEDQREAEGPGASRRAGVGDPVGAGAPMGAGEQPGGGEQPVAGERRAERIDETFAAAGIGPGHPSLYPDRKT